MVPTFFKRYPISSNVTKLDSKLSKKLLIGQHNSPSQVTGVTYLSQNSDGRSNASVYGLMAK